MTKQRKLAKAKRDSNESRLWHRLVNHKWSHSLAPAIVGAILGALLSGIPAVYIQMRSQRKDALIARELEAIESYLKACNQIVDDGFQVTDVAARAFENEEAGNPDG